MAQCADQLLVRVIHEFETSLSFILNEDNYSVKKKQQLIKAAIRFLDATRAIFLRTGKSFSEQDII